MERPRAEGPERADLLWQEATQESSTMEKHLTIEVSSGGSSGEDSDVEFLGFATPNRGRGNCDSAGNTTTQLDPVRTAHPKPLAQRVQTKKATNSKKATQEYICKRCNKPGHRLADCPTNLDPSYDTKPPSRYTCAVCGAVEEHHGTLCPQNTAPWSLNQLRLRRGIISWDGHRERDGNYYRVSRDPNRMEVMARKRPRETTADFSRYNEVGSARSFANDFDHMHESRREQVEHAQSRQKSPEDGRMVDYRGGGRRSSLPPKRLRRLREEAESEGEHADDDFYGRHHWEDRNKRRHPDHGVFTPFPDEVRSPLPKRPRRQREEVESEGEHANDDDYGQYHKEDRNKRRRHDHRVPFPYPGEVQYGYTDRARSPELLPVVRRDSRTSGRLSYWDNEYSSPRHVNKRSDANEPWSAPRRDSDIEWEHARHMDKRSDTSEPWFTPQRDSDTEWEHEMATFDVDKFLESMDEHLIAYELARSRRSMMAPTDLSGANSQGEPNNDTARAHCSCSESAGTRNANSNARAIPDEAEGTSPAVKASSSQATRVVPVYTVERND